MFNDIKTTVVELFHTHKSKLFTLGQIVLTVMAAALLAYLIGAVFFWLLAPALTTAGMAYMGWMALTNIVMGLAMAAAFIGTCYYSYQHGHELRPRFGLPPLENQEQDNKGNRSHEKAADDGKGEAPLKSKITPVAQASGYSAPTSASTTALTGKPPTADSTDSSSSSSSANTSTTGVTPDQSTTNELSSK